MADELDNTSGGGDEQRDKNNEAADTAGTVYESATGFGEGLAEGAKDELTDPLNYAPAGLGPAARLGKNAKRAFNFLKDKGKSIWDGTKKGARDLKDAIKRKFGLPPFGRARGFDYEATWCLCSQVAGLS